MVQQSRHENRNLHEVAADIVGRTGRTTPRS